MVYSGGQKGRVHLEKVVGAMLWIMVWAERVLWIHPLISASRSWTIQRCYLIPCGLSCNLYVLVRLSKFADVSIPDWI